MRIYEGEITFLHRDRIERIRREAGHTLSSHAFVSLWLWRKRMDLRLYLEDELFAVRAKGYGGNTWFFPCGSEERKIAFIEARREEADFALCYMREEDLRFMERHFGGSFEFRPDLDASEYIYDRKEMQEMAGGRFSNMRKQIGRIMKAHEVYTEKIGSRNLADAAELVQKHAVPARTAGYHFLRDDGIAEEALQNLEALGLFGVLVYLDGEPQSLALGFALTPDTADGCIEKHRGNVSGISYLTQREFFLSAPENYRFLNSEEDMGIPGLRDMKRHMCPVGKNELWEARMGGKSV